MAKSKQPFPLNGRDSKRVCRSSPSTVSGARVGQPRCLRSHPGGWGGALVRVSGWFCLWRFRLAQRCSERPGKAPVPTGHPGPVETTFARPSAMSGPLLKSQTHPRQFGAPEKQVRTSPHPYPGQAGLSLGPRLTWFLLLRAGTKMTLRLRCGVI